MSQAGRYTIGGSPFPPIVSLTADDGSVVTPDAAQNIDVFGSAGANGAINIQTDGFASGLPAHELGIRLTDSILLPFTNAAATSGVIAFGTVGYANDRILHNYNNSFFAGYQAGNFTLGANLSNTGIGTNALQGLTTGSFNTAVGENSQQATTSGANNTSVGGRTLQFLTTGARNTALGKDALRVITTQSDNTAVGYQSGRLLQTGQFNTSVGSSSLVLASTCNNNTAVGYLALATITDGSDNTAVGSEALGALTGFQTQNTAVGRLALSVCNSDNNTAVGCRALFLTVTGTDNVALGFQTARLNNSGDRNTIAGNWAMTSNTSGDDNVAMGFEALYTVNGVLFTTDGEKNVSIGNQSLRNLATGKWNTALGYQAGISYNAAENSNICILNSGTAGENNTIRIGTNGAGLGQQNTCFVAGITGNTVANTQMVTINSATTQLGVATIPTGVTNWSTITLSQTAAVNNGYFCNNAGTLQLALPAVSVVGDIIEVVNINNATGTQLTQAAGQQIFIGNTNTTLGAGGTLTSIAVGDTLRLVCRTANTIWQVLSQVGSWTPV